ncbi:MAG: hypothetical protein OHK0040_05140 [bacterium]
MRQCEVCGKSIDEKEGDFKYFSDEGKQLTVCGVCYLQLKKKDYKSGEDREDGSSM